MNTQVKTPAVEVPAYVLADDIQNGVREGAVVLAAGDKAFEGVVAQVAEMVARMLGTEPAFDHWNAVAGHFQTTYAEARGCNEETARKRWSAVARDLEERFALEKPAKPTKAAEKKAEQRKGAAAEAQALIERAQATTPAEVLALSGETPKASVVAALAKRAGEMAAEGAKAANDAAKEETRTLRETIRKGLTALTLEQLRQVSELMGSFNPVTEMEEAPM